MERVLWRGVVEVWRGLGVVRGRRGRLVVLVDMCLYSSMENSGLPRPSALQQLVLFVLMIEKKYSLGTVVGLFLNRQQNDYHVTVEIEGAS